MLALIFAGKWAIRTICDIFRSAVAKGVVIHLTMVRSRAASQAEPG